MEPTAPRNLIREALSTGRFLYTLEYVPDPIDGSGHKGLDHLAKNAALVGADPRIGGVNIGDRVAHLNSHDTVECGKLALAASGKMPLLHLAGKDRTPEQAVGVLKRAIDAGLRNFLLVSGDRVVDPARSDRIRYHDSVVAIMDAKRLAPDCFVAAAVSPFKYREEELLNQYLKMAKKINAGANYLITNCGWDMAKFEELIWYRDARGFDAPVVANLLLPTQGWARGIHSGRLPGVHMSDGLFAKIQEEYKLGKAHAQERAFNRIALQVIGVRLMGYAGVHLSGVETHESLGRVVELVETMQESIADLEQWRNAWSDAHVLEDGTRVTFPPDGGLFLFSAKPEAGSMSGPPVLGNAVPSSEETRKYRWMRAAHHHLFDRHSIGRAIVRPVLQLVNATAAGKRALVDFERKVKAPILGCETCGFCRIPYLSYVCPETCPKGLANGPCSGTSDNVCEFKDRECIHNRKYRLAKAAGALRDLEEILVPAVSSTRMTSSWINEYNGTLPEVTRRRAKTVVAEVGSGGRPSGAGEERE